MAVMDLHRGNKFLPTSLVRSILNRFRSYRIYRLTFAELNRLDDRELNDLGISRHDIRIIARNHRSGNSSRS